MYRVPQGRCRESYRAPLLANSENWRYRGIEGKCFRVLSGRDVMKYSRQDLRWYETNRREPDAFLKYLLVEFFDSFLEYHKRVLVRSECVA
jgi:hypothetical protein